MYFSDNEILEKILSGKQHLFAELIDRYKAQAMTLAMRMLKNREEAEEAIQDAFIRAFNALDKFEGRSKFNTWLYRIVYNVCLTRLRNKGTELVFIREEAESELPEEIYPSVTPLADYENKEMVEIVKAAIEDLPQKYGTILSLFYFQELTYEEIGEVTLLPIGTVKTHLFRARALLVKCLTNEYEIELMER